jgi:hypothetical protein
MDDLTGADGGLRELALFAGAGGGILGGQILGWRTVCAVEREPYAAGVLVARQNDGFSRLSRFGMTFAPLMADRGEELLTWFLAASRARTSASPEKERESTASDPGYGVKWRGSLAKFDPDSRSWKTAQLSLIEDSDESSVIWPRSGMTADGQCYLLPTLAPRTKGDRFWLVAMAHGVAARVDRLRAIGNGQVPQCSAQAWRLLTDA